MSCLANDLFKKKMQDLIWDGLLHDAKAWESFCHDKTRVTDFMDKSKTIIDLDCLIEKLGSFVPDILTKNEYDKLVEIWDKTKKRVKFFN